MTEVHNDTLRVTVEAGTNLYVHNLHGKIAVRSGGDGVIVVRPLHDGEPDLDAVDVRQENGSVRVQVNHYRGAREIELELEVPRGCRVEADSVSADIEVVGVSGMAKLQSTRGDILCTDAGEENAASQISAVDGDVTLTNARGEWSLHGTNGDLIANDLDGSLSAHVTNGDLTVNQGNLRHFHVDGTNGSITISTPLAAGAHYFARTINGDIDLQVPDDARFTVQMRTVHGDIHCDLPHEVINASRRNRQLRINGGGATVELETTHGDMHVTGNGAAGDRPDEDGRGHRHDSVSIPAVPSVPAVPPVPAVPAVPSVPSMSFTAPPPPAPPTSGFRDLSDIPEMPDLPGLDDLPSSFEHGGHTSSDVDTPAEGSAPREDTLEVLARLERGELTIDEAMERLSTR